jgi:hypothetical protein
MMCWATALLFAATGCAPTFVNLTPDKLPKTPTSVYPFEVQWESPRNGANNADVRAYVVIGTNLYSLARVADTTNRWEGTAPVPPGASFVPYRFKFVDTYPGIRDTHAESSLSAPYRLIVAPNP